MDDKNWEQLEDDWESRLIEYTMGVMSPTDAAQFEQQLSECRMHVKLTDQYMQVAGWLGTAAPAAEPPAGHKARLMSRIASTTQEQNTNTQASSTISPVAADTATTPAVPLAFPSARTTPASDDILRAEDMAPATTESSDTLPYNVTPLGEARRKRGLSRNVALFSSLAAAVVILLGAAWLYSLLSRPYIPGGWNSLALQSQNGAAQSSAVVLVMNNNRNDALLIAGNLDQLPAGEVYELWLLPQPGASDTNPVPTVVFTPNSIGTVRQDVKAPSSMKAYLAVAITVEHSYVTAPTTKPILVGQNTAPQN